MNLQTVFDEAYHQTDGDQSHAPYDALIEALAERGAISAALRYGEKPLVIYTIGALFEYETEVISLDAERHGLLTATRSQRRRIARKICHRLPLDAPLEAIRTAFQDARQQSPTADDERSCHVQYFEALAQRGALSAALDRGDEALERQALDAIDEFERERKFHPLCRPAQPVACEA